MSDATRNPETAADAARRMLEENVERRVQAVVAIVTASNDVNAARADLNDANGRHAKAWADALASGWSEKELRAAGAPRPDQTRVRPTRSRRPSAADVAAPDAAAESDAESIGQVA